LQHPERTVHVGEGIAVTVFQSGFDEKILIKICLKIFSQGSIEKIKSRFD
jgi:hypothetical protein